MADVIQFSEMKCLHTGPENTGMNYEMGGTIIRSPNMKVAENAGLQLLRTTRLLE